MPEKPGAVVHSGVTSEPSTFLTLQQAVSGRFVVERQIGQGGMAVVYLARDLKLDRPVAIKLLRPQLAHHDTARARFLQEARVAARLSHPNVIRVFTVEEHGGLAFFVTEYVDGGTVAEAVRREGPFAPYRAAEILREVAWALGYAHDKGVVHRDVKPDNILLERTAGRALIGDFGIALLDQRHGLTGEGMAVGTADYVSPEQAAGKEVDARSDIYSLGATAFFMLTGRPPFKGADDAKILMMHRSEPAPSMASIRPDVPEPLVNIVDSCLQKEPGARYAHSRSIADELGEFLAGRHVVEPEIRDLVSKTDNLTNRLAILAPLSGVIVYALEGLSKFGVADVFLLLWVGWILLVELLVQPISLLSDLRRIVGSGITYQDFRESVLADVTERLSDGDAGAGRLRWRLVVGLLAISVATASLLLATTEALPGGTVGLRSLGVALLMVTIGLLGTLMISVWGVPRGDPALRRTIWGGSFGRFLFKLAGWRLKRAVGPDTAGNLDAEQVLAARCNSMLQQLPAADRRKLREIRSTIARLQRDGTELRKRMRVLNRALRQVRDLAHTPNGSPEDELASDDRSVAALRLGTEQEILGRLQNTSDRLAAIRRELDTIRLGLIRIQARTTTADELVARLEVP